MIVFCLINCLFSVIIAISKYLFSILNLQRVSMLESELGLIVIIDYIIRIRTDIMIDVGFGICISYRLEIADFIFRIEDILINVILAYWRREIRFNDVVE